MKKTTIRSGGVPQSRYDAARRRSTKPAIGGVKTDIVKGTIAPRKLQCFSVACIDMPQLEFGDKIVLPSSVLLELQCFKVPTPMLFHIRSFGAQQDSDEAHAGFAQYCSVQEFSAPDGQVFIPYWMMQNLHIAEGADVTLTNVRDIPRGIYCRLQPEDPAFLDIAAEIGPKLLMESALRRYSVMSVDETILIDHGSQRFYVKVVELKPGNVVSLLGDVDLEMDFVAPPRADLRRPKSGSIEPEVNQVNQEDHKAPHLESPAIADPIVSTPVGFGRRLGDGVCVADDNTKASEVEKVLEQKASKLGNGSFQAVQKRIAVGGSSQGLATDMVAKRADTESLAKDVKLAQAAFFSIGHRLGGRGDGAAQVDTNPARELPHSSTSCQTVPASSSVSTNVIQCCPMCLAEVSCSNMDLHTMRCAKNPSYHKFKCEVCEAKVLEIDRVKHLHCPQCKELVENDDELAAHVGTAHSANHRCPDCGGTSFKLADLDIHLRIKCPQALDLCKLCGFKIKRKDMSSHTQACSSRTERCDVCQKYIKIVDLDDHIVLCVSDRDGIVSESLPATIPTTSNQHDDLKAALECIYCMKRGFLDRRQHDRHVNQECVVARSFRSPMGSLPETKSAMASTTSNDVRMLIQGKLKRRADAKTLSDSSSQLSFDTTALLQRTSSSNQRDTGPDLLIKARPHVNPSKPKPRTIHKQSHRPTQLESLPVKPTPPRSHDVSPTELFVGKAISGANTPQPRLHAQRDPATRRLQSLHKQL